MGFLIPWENDDHDERENSVPVRKSDDEISGECRNRDDAILRRSLSASLISLLKPTAGNHAVCFHSAGVASRKLREAYIIPFRLST